MSDEKNVMQDALVSIIQKTQQGIDASVSFLSEQIPDVIQQLLLWKFVEGLIICAAYLVFAFTLVPTLRWAREYHKDYDACDFPGHIFVAVIMSFTSLVSCILAVKSGLTALQIYIAPKVYLIEYAASLVK